MANIRSNRQKQINTDYQLLFQLISKANEISRDAKYYKKYEYGWGEDLTLDLRCEKLIERIDNFNEEVLNLPERIFVQFELEDENIFTDLTSDEITECYRNIEDFEDHKCYEIVYDKMISYIDSAIKIISPVLNKYRELFRFKEVVDIMITLFDQREVLEDYIASEKREEAEKNAKKMYVKHMSVEDIADVLGYSVKTVEKWLEFTTQAY